MTEHEALRNIKNVLDKWERSDERDTVSNEKAVNDIYFIVYQITWID